MKYLNLDGNIYDQKLRTKQCPQASKLQKEFIEWLKITFVGEPIFEEVRIDCLMTWLDCFMPQRKWAFEIDGQQHRKFVKHFHKTPFAFKMQKIRDREKSTWCELNDIMLFRIDDKNVESTKTKLKSFLSS